MAKQRLLIWGMVIAIGFTMAYFAVTLYHIQGEADNSSTVAVSTITDEDQLGLSTTPKDPASPAPSSGVSNPTESGATPNESGTVPEETETPDTSHQLPETDLKTPNETPAPEATTPSTNTPTETVVPSDQVSETASEPTQTTSEQPTPSSTPTISTEPSRSADKKASVEVPATTSSTMLQTLHLSRIAGASQADNHFMIEFTSPYKNAEVTIQIQSDPITIATRSDEKGRVSYEFREALPEGKHTMTILVKDPNSDKIARTSRPFFIQKAHAASDLEQFLVSRDYSFLISMQYLIMIASAIILTLLVAYSIYKQNMQNTDEILY